MPTNVKVKPRSQADGTVLYDVVKVSTDGVETVVETTDDHEYAKELADLARAL